MSRKGSENRTLPCNFHWSLQPLIVCMKFALGLNLDVVQESAFPIRFIPAFGFFVILGNLVINGPCSFYSKIQFEREGHFYDSPFLRVSEQAFSLVSLIMELTGTILFLALPTIHIVFMINVLLKRNWKDLWVCLQKIQNEMSLNYIFHQKCRKVCFTAILFILLVRNYSIHIFVVL